MRINLLSRLKLDILPGVVPRRAELLVLRGGPLAERPALAPPDRDGRAGGRGRRGRRQRGGRVRHAQVQAGAASKAKKALGVKSEDVRT